MRDIFIQWYPHLTIRIERLVAITAEGPVYEAVPAYTYAGLFRLSLRWLSECRQRRDFPGEGPNR
jgi:hypothetical protein